MHQLSTALRLALVVVIALGVNVAVAQFSVAPATCSAGQYLAWSGAAWSCTTPASGMPSGAIFYFNGACPAGSTEVTAARGRMIVGTPLSGTDAGTVGTALTNAQDKALALVVLNHTHPITDAGHTHTIQAQGGTTLSTASAHLSGSTATGGSSRAMATPEAANSNTTGITVSNPSGGSASQSVSTSSVVAYVQYHTCSAN